MTQNDSIFSVSTSPNSTKITKLVLNNNTSICLCTLFAVTNKVRIKRKNFKLNRKGGRFEEKTRLKAEDLPLIGRLGRSELMPSGESSGGNSGGGSLIVRFAR